LFQLVTATLSSANKYFLENKIAIDTGRDFFSAISVASFWRSHVPDRLAASTQRLNQLLIQTLAQWGHCRLEQTNSGGFDFIGVVQRLMFSEMLASSGSRSSPYSPRRNSCLGNLVYFPETSQNR
jgi:hypothetical protein